MSEFASVTSALLAQVSKLLKTLSDSEIKLLATGETKLSLVGPGQRVIDKSPALDRALKVLEGLSEDDVRRLEDKRANLVLIRKGDTVVPAFDPDEVAAKVAAQPSEAEMIRVLSADTRLSVVNLKKVAEVLNIVVPPTMKAKTALQLYIAERVSSDRGVPA